MGRQLTENELKRFNRVLAGHARDKDRARRKRKLQGQVQTTQKPLPGSDGAEPLDPEELEAEPEKER